MEHLKLEFEDRLRTLRSHNNVDNEDLRKEATTRLDSLTDTVHRIDTNVTELYKVLDDKLTKLAVNGDHVNDIQR